jgi:hypothetical protein
MSNLYNYYWAKAQEVNILLIIQVIAYNSKRKMPRICEITQDKHQADTLIITGSKSIGVGGKESL